MRDDQRTRLLALQEKLIDQFLGDADPVNWNGHGVLPSAMDRDTRGDAYWCKKNAAATMMVLTGVDKLLANTKDALGRDPYENDDLDKQIKRAEAEAQQRTDELMRKTARAAFNAKVNGKAH